MSQEALARKIQTLPEILRTSLTWDQSPEMCDWKQAQVASDIDVYFADPHSPWQRPLNENTDGLLRRRFPKGSDLSCTAKPISTPSPSSSTSGPANG